MIERRQVLQLRAGSASGTGFLIATGKLATALHVIVELDEFDRPIIHSGEPVPLQSITCIYYSAGECRTEPVEFDPDRDPYDIAEDWVVLSVANLPANVVWNWRQLESTHDFGKECRAYGFPNDMGEPFDGKITGVGDPASIDGQPRVHRVRFEQASGSTALSPQGMSGSPVVVGDRVVGLIRSFVRASGDPESPLHDLARAGTVWVTPIESLDIATRETGHDATGAFIAALGRLPDVYTCLKGCTQLSQAELAHKLMNTDSVLAFTRPFVDAMKSAQDTDDKRLADHLLDLYCRLAPTVAARCSPLGEGDDGAQTVTALHPQAAEPSMAGARGRAIEFGDRLDTDRLRLPKRFISSMPTEIPDPGLDLGTAVEEVTRDRLRRSEVVLEHVAAQLVDMSLSGSLEDRIMSLEARFTEDPRNRNDYTMVTNAEQPLMREHVRLLRAAGLCVLTPATQDDPTMKQSSFKLRQALHSLHDIYHSIPRGTHGST